MANISSKISSIEPEDDMAAKAAGLMSKPERGGDLSSSTAQGSRDGDKLPDFITNAKGRSDPYMEAEAPSFRWVNIVIILSAIFWIATAAIVIYSFFDLGSGLKKFTALQWAGLSLFVIGPVLMLWVTGYALRQLARLSGQAHRLSVTAQQLLTPDDTAVSRTALMANSIRKEIDQVSHRVDTALSRMSSLQETLDGQLQAINRTTYITENKSELIASRLSEERGALTAISSSFDDTMKALSSTLDTHGENLARSTKAAEQKIQEARISVEGATAKISSASELVLKNTIEAGSKLDGNQAEISRLGKELEARAAELDTLYSKHTVDLASMISDLRDEQENLGSSLEARLQKMRDMSLSAQVSAQHLTEASTSGRQTVEALADAARLTDTAVKQRFADMEEMVKYSNARAESISETAARRVQDSLGQTRKEIARIEYDMVALQDKLKRSSQDLPLADTPAPKSLKQEAATPPKKRSGIAGLKPAADDEDMALEVPAQDAPKTKRPSLRKRLAGLRPAPEPTEVFEEAAQPQPKTASANDAATHDTKKDTPKNDPFELVIPHFTDVPDISEPADDIHELVLEAPTEDDLLTPDPNQQLLQFDPDVLRRTVSNDTEELISPANEKPRNSWWKALLNGGQTSETSAIDQLTAVPKKANAPVTDDQIIKALADMGLAPGAVVDDGCIIEAVNTRMGKGPLAMSEVITHRLEDPVRHLYETISSDAALKTKFTNFARRFHTGLGEIEGDREAIRSRLESDSGRAFLLCDAALNR